MADGRTLFERITQPRVKAATTPSQRKDVLVRSIVQHLRDLLNTRQGCCSAAPDYGMPDLQGETDSRGRLARELETKIRNTITRYEPRLGGVRVRMQAVEEARLAPRFVITARLTGQGDYSKDVSFSTIVDPLGKIEIS